MKAKLLPPRGNYMGNILWNAAERAGKETLIANSLEAIREMGYWASPFPEGDGVTFKNEGEKRTPEQMLMHFSAAFPWLHIERSMSGDGNTDLVGLTPGTEICCTVIVPLARICIQESFDIGDYHFVCRKEFDEQPHERLGDFDTEYLQFEATLNYSDLLRVNRKLAYNDFVINKCLALAEHVMDVVRFQFSSFKWLEFTPNPAGQLDNGFYAIEIIPDGNTHLKSMSLEGISRPMSASNNWLGPEVGYQMQPGCGFLSQVLVGRRDELGIRVKAALQGCRQSFYTLGDESKFLNLIFTLDGLIQPKWTGWMHRIHISALISRGDILKFIGILRRYNELYAEIRNELVHGGKDFYELSHDSNQACEDVYQYIKSIICLIESDGFSTLKELHEYARTVLIQYNFIDACTVFMRETLTEQGNTSAKIKSDIDKVVNAIKLTEKI
jgi:hypothetical protein